MLHFTENYMVWLSDALANQTTQFTVRGDAPGPVIKSELFVQAKQYLRQVNYFVSAL